MKKLVKYGVPLIVLGLLAKFLPIVAAVLVLCGIYDVLRNKKLDGSIVLQYFFGNGLLTWLLSPFNTLLDILCLPYINKGVYKLTDLPKPYQEEISGMLDAARAANLVQQIEERTKGQSRSMIFFKWYGANVDTFLDVPAFHQKFRFIQTIGISVFSKKVSTSRHFGPFRASLRVLYNINDMEDDSAYIVVGDVTQYWRTEKLFIFDDTLLHQSFNESDKARYCMFVDIVRPALWTLPLVGVIRSVRFFMKGMNYVFYKNWKVIAK